MKVTVSRRRLILLLAAVIGLATTVWVKYSHVCYLEAVTLNGEVVNDWETEFGLTPDRSILQQPVDSLASELLSQEGIFKVDVGYRLPNMIELRTNDFTPVCFVLDQNSGRLYGLNSQARVVSLGESIADWEHPVLCNVAATRLYSHCDDPRVRIIVPQLMRLRASNIDLYRLIDEVDFTHTEYLVVSVSGLSYRLKVSAEHLLRQVGQFIEFLEQFDPDLERTRMLDMRFENMIIRVGETG